MIIIIIIVNYINIVYYIIYLALLTSEAFELVKTIWLTSLFYFITTPVRI